MNPADGDGNELFLPANPTIPADSPRANGESLKLQRGFIPSVLPTEGQCEVIVTSMSTGPTNFTVQLTVSEYGLMLLDQNLRKMDLHNLPTIPEIGTPCIVTQFNPDEKRASINGRYRGVVTGTDRFSRMCTVKLVDYGNVEEVHYAHLYEIPEELLAVKSFGCSVSLIDPEELPDRTQMWLLNAIFAKFVEPDRALLCEVVDNDKDPKRVHLYCRKGRNLMDVVMGIYSFLSSNEDFSGSPTPMVLPESQIWEVEIPEVPLNKIERLFIVHTLGRNRFFGQLEKRPETYLEKLLGELCEIYNDNPIIPLLYADGESHLEGVGVYKWPVDDKHYRIRVLEEFENGQLKIELMDYGNRLVVPQQAVLAPVEALSSQFSQPAFGVHCALDEGEIVVMEKTDFDMVLLGKSVEIRFGERKKDGSYSVTFTDDPCNNDIVHALFPKPKENGSLENTTELKSAVPCSSGDCLESHRKRSNPKREKRQIYVPPHLRGT